MHFVYTSLFYLILPFILLRLFWRGFKAPIYRKRWLERLAIYKQQYPNKVIWFHAVSVGEAEAVFPLIKRVQQRYPENPILVTTTTPTGSSRVEAILGNSVSHVYLPYDIPIVIKRFLVIFKPKIAIFMEKEIWPNLYAQSSQNNIPIMIVNARLSANSAKGYKKIPSLIVPALSHVSWIATQTEEDRQRFVDIGAQEKLTSVTGNMKFDLELDDNIVLRAKNLKKQLFNKRFVWIIASTHKNEEAIFLEIYPALKKQIPELLLMIVPRHPERFDEVNQLAKNMQLNTCMRNSEQECKTNTDVYIVNTMGELKIFYGVADICFVGGSMVPVGGHNILEPAAMNVPIMFGPYMVNFKQITQHILNLGAGIQCEDKLKIMETVLQLYNDEAYRTEIATKAYRYFKNNQGAVERVAELIFHHLN